MGKKPTSSQGKMFAGLARFFNLLSDLAETNANAGKIINTVDSHINRIEEYKDRYSEHFGKTTLPESLVLSQQRKYLIDAIRNEVTRFQKEQRIESIHNHDWLAKTDQDTYILVMTILRKIRELSDDIGVSETDLTQFILDRSSNPDIKQRIAKAPAGPTEFSRDPLHEQRTVKRLVEKFGAAAKEFAEAPEGSRERLLAGYTVITSYDALKKRGYNVDDLPERDRVTEARRIKQAHIRARAKLAV